MKKIAYIYGDVSEETMVWIYEYKPDKVYRDRGVNGQTRPQMKAAVKALKQGDEFIIVSFGNCIRHTFSAPLLFSFCEAQDIRLISIQDRIDTHGQVFGNQTEKSVLRMFMGLGEEILKTRRSTEQPETGCSNTMLSKSELRSERERRVITLYLAGQSIEIIMRVCGIKHTALYQILKRHGIQSNRRLKDVIAESPVAG